MPVGVGLRPSFINEVLDENFDLPMIEILSDNFMNVGGRPAYLLDQVRQKYPIACHGIGLSIGSVEPLRLSYLESLKNLVNQIGPVVVSDHLSFSRNGRHNSHDLLPIPYTKETFQRVRDKILQVQDCLKRPLALENPSAYIQFKNNDFSEAEFLRELCAETHCEIMLDLNNLVVNAHNLSLDPRQYLKVIQNCTVRQFHLAGHMISQTPWGEVRIDTHDHAPDADTLSLYAEAQKMWPKAIPILEWDDKIPTWTEIKVQMARINGATVTPLSFGLAESQANDFSFIQGTVKSEKAPTQMGSPSLDAQTMLFSVATHSQKIIDAHLFSHPRSVDLGLQVYVNAYELRSIEVMGNLFPSVKYIADDLFPDIVRHYLRKHPPTRDSIDDIGLMFADYLKDNPDQFDLGVDSKLIADLALFEETRNTLHAIANETSKVVQHADLTSEIFWTQAQLKKANSSRVLKFDYPVHETWTVIQKQELPQPPSQQQTHCLMYRNGFAIEVDVISPREFAFLQSIDGVRSMSQIADHLKTTPDELLRLVMRFIEILVFQNDHMSVHQNLYTKPNPTLSSVIINPPDQAH